MPSTTPSNPCAFLIDPANPVLNELARQKQIRDESGYPEDTPLADAVRLFNEELQCYSQWASLPPLTEEEVIASILAGSDYGTKESWKLQSKILSDIISQKKMPRGSLLINTDGGRAIDYPLGKKGGFVVEARGQRIYIFLNLDKIPHKGGYIMRPEQFFLIRKNISVLKNS